MVLLALGLASAIFLVRRDSAERRGGPLAQRAVTSSWASIDVPVGEPVSFGLVGFQNRGGSPARLISVRVVAQSRGLRVLGIYVTLRPPGIGLLRGFPPPGTDTERWSSPEGAVVDPGKRGWVVVGAEATEEGLQGFEGLEVTYEVSGHRYVARFPHGLVLCVAPHEPSELCPAGPPERGT